MGSIGREFCEMRIMKRRVDGVLLYWDWCEVETNLMVREEKVGVWRRGIRK